MEPRRFYLHFANEAYLGETLDIAAAPIPQEAIDSFLPGPLSGYSGGKLQGYYLMGEKKDPAGGSEGLLGFEGALIGETLPEADRVETP